MRAGDVVLYNARPLHAGLGAGSSDLIGWLPLKITKEHVGQTLAVFTAVEVKAERGITTPEQKTFIDVVNKSGGVGFVAKHTDEIKRGFGL